MSLRGLPRPFLQFHQEGNFRPSQRRSQRLIGQEMERVSEWQSEKERKAGHQLGAERELRYQSTHFRQHDILRIPCWEDRCRQKWGRRVLALRPEMFAQRRPECVRVRGKRHLTRT